MNKQAATFKFYDLHPAPLDFHAEIIAGLSRLPRSIPPKFFYDQQGSRLFAEICRTPEYYPTRTETAILRDNIDAIVARLGADCLLVEPGSGDSRKVRELLDILRPFAYLPMDISSEFLRQQAERLAAEFPWLDVHAVCADFTDALTLPYKPEDKHRVAFFPGSTIGNFTPEQAGKFLADLACMVGSGGGLLIGVDLIKEKHILDAAYNDAAGVTAAFNRNLLQRINRELGADFVIDQFEHLAYFDPELSRIEMHLRSRCDQRVRIADCCFDFRTGETIHTENSYKYSLSGFQDLARSAGFVPVDAWTDAQQLFSVHYCSVP